MENDLQEYANSMSSGYLKSWKATSMVRTFQDLIYPSNDKERSLKWVKNCLEMEGFKSADCEQINEWFWDKKNG